MKKFFEKYDLIKIAFGMILLSLLLTWIIPQGYFNGSELVNNGITRMGIFDFVTYGLLGMYYFTVLITFIFVLGAFYQYLSKLDSYQKLTDKIAKKIKGKEIFFSLVVSFIFAGLASIINEYLVLIAFMPFIITILSKAKFDKISAFAATFGAMLVGLLGSTINTKIAGMNVQYFGLKYTDNLLEKILIFAIAFILFSVLNIIQIRKNFKNNTSKKKNAESVQNDIDIFSNTSKYDEKSNTIPLIIVGILMVIVSLLAYLPWTDVFNVSWFTDLYNKAIGVQLFNVPIVSYLLGNVTEFGTWDLFGIQVVMLLAILVLQICYRPNFNTIIESFKEGFSKVSKLVVILLMSYVILEIAVMYPVIPTIIGKFLGTKFNVFTSTLAAIVASLFTSEYQYTVNLVYTYLTSSYAGNLNVVSIIFQSIYGLISFITPASAMLLVGLSYLDISYKNWLKFIWKFLVAMLVVIVVMALIIA